MKKNNIFKIGLLSLGLLMLAGCSKDYLETTPTDEVSTEDAFATVGNSWSALNGIHRILYSQVFGTQAQGGQSGNMLYMDILGEDVVFPTLGSTWLRDDYRWISHRNPSSNSAEYNYLFYYVIIGNANMIIANVDDAEGAEADKRYIKGQALAYRAWSYFQMVQLFGERYVNGAANDGLAVPLVLAPSTASVPRSTVSEVYAQIDADLKEAEALLEGYSRGTDKSQISQDIVRGYLARVALVKQDYQLAAQYASAAREGFALMSNTDYLGGFNNYDISEWMWSSRIQADQTNYFYSFFAYMSLNYSSSVIRSTPKVINSKLYDQIAETDVRKKLWDPTGADVENFPLPLSTFTRHKYQSKKFRVANEALSIGDVPYMRAGEMYLIEAEALAALGDARATDVLYEFAVNRDPEYTRSTSTGQTLLNEILLQRRVELWGEGFRFYDLKRNNLALDRTGANHNTTYAVKMQQAAGTKEWQFLIPQDEINNSGGVVSQNPQ